ncbi:hypothetical protein BV25DRAFT_1820529 [Artomyces pyxidatus]|uniref:Uncharacterized protein n=1 Tax=Artomyces pyxidatus TaxID=48021 RepID=A0ACB8TDP0_9AGAM|nr:hypothetical protein BV25DRAFT_1820529 [Artomyces pyxidatus]
MTFDTPHDFPLYSLSPSSALFLGSALTPSRAARGIPTLILEPSLILSYVFLPPRSSASNGVDAPCDRRTGSPRCRAYT